MPIVCKDTGDLVDINLWPPFLSPDTIDLSSYGEGLFADDQGIKFSIDRRTKTIIQWFDRPGCQEPAVPDELLE